MDEESIQGIEKSLISKKAWKYSGEIKASARPKDSLLDTEIDFETAVFNVPVSAEQNNEITRYITQRFREKTFDNYEFKEVKEKIEVEVYDVEICETNKEILALYDSIEVALKRMTDFGNDGFL